jgi:peroxiredoxin
MLQHTNASVTGRSIHIVLIVGLLVVSTLINVLQARKINRLENAIVSLKSEGRLSEGSIVPRIEAKDLDGNALTLSYTEGQQPTVLYVFSPQCKWCERNLGSVKALAKIANGSYRFVTITLSEDNLREYIANKDFRFPVYTRLSVETLRAYKLGGTPQTLVISGDGRVQKNWMGAYMGETKTDIEAFFKTKLPDLPQS